MLCEFEEGVRKGIKKLKVEAYWREGSSRVCHTYILLTLKVVFL